MAFSGQHSTRLPADEQCYWADRESISKNGPDCTVKKGRIEQGCGTGQATKAPSAQRRRLDFLEPQLTAERHCDCNVSSWLHVGIQQRPDGPWRAKKCWTSFIVAVIPSTVRSYLDLYSFQYSITDLLVRWQAIGHAQGGQPRRHG